jgi:predicted nucleic acid-binding protein
MKGLIVDTGVFYALLDADDSYHKQAQAELNQIILKLLKIQTQKSH